MDSTNLYKRQIELAKMSRDVLADLKGTRFGMWFHLRPISDEITVVTTHSDFPIRGVPAFRKNVRKSKANLCESLDFIEECIASDDKTIDWEKIKAAGYKDGKGFEIGTPNKEYKHQANMINGLYYNNQLKEALGVKNLYFTASEVVFRRGHGGGTEKIDIVAHDGAGKVFFFEMKAPENDKDNPVEQVKEYLDLYGKSGKRNNAFEKIVSVYPQNPIERVDEYIGCAVVGYKDNLISCENTEYPDVKLLKFYD